MCYPRSRSPIHPLPRARRPRRNHRLAISSTKIYELHIIKDALSENPKAYRFPVTEQSLDTTSDKSLRYLRNLTPTQLDFLSNHLAGLNQQLESERKAKYEARDKRKQEEREKKRLEKAAAKKERCECKCEDKCEPLIDDVHSVDDGYYTSDYDSDGDSVVDEDFETNWYLEGIDVELEPSEIKVRTLPNTVPLQPPYPVPPPRRAVGSFNIPPPPPPLPLINTEAKLDLSVKTWRPVKEINEFTAIYVREVPSRRRNIVNGRRYRGSYTPTEDDVKVLIVGEVLDEKLERVKQEKEKKDGGNKGVRSRSCETVASDMTETVQNKTDNESAQSDNEIDTLEIIDYD